MIYINEWLPNPSGSDAENEWVELWNGGEAVVNLDGWKLADQNGKGFSLSGSIGAGEYLFLPRSDTKLTLHNTDGALALYDASGGLADKAQFLGTAPEGKSYSRQDGALFIFAEPTPGAQNVVLSHLPLATNNYPLGLPLNPPIGWLGISGAAVGVALVFSALVMIVLERNENIKNLLFKRDPEIR